MHRCFLLLAVLLVTACRHGGDAGEAPAVGGTPGQRVSGSALPARDTLIVLVRHAEKATDDPTDPSLSSAGRARAQALAQVLAGSKVDAIYATQFRRTRDTAAPLAQSLNLEVQVRPIDVATAAGYSKELAEHIRRTHAGQVVLVVGHSNTVPDLVAELSGVTVPPIAESEYTRLYAIGLDGKSAARVIAANY